MSDRQECRCLTVPVIIPNIPNIVRMITAGL
jgi:hypothetical protein